MPDNKSAPFLNATQTWLKTVVIEHSICPFAKRELDCGSIRFTVNHNTDTESCLLDLIDECGLLDADERIETTLLIYAKAFADFDSYLDFLEIAEALMLEQGYEGIYQLASFHPHYCFDGARPDDAANYTNRSPYPMLHLLREASLELAIDSYPQPEAIPQRNIELTRSLGLTTMQALLKACYILDK
ncbi:MAG: DUF1415 domain-containing protein [Methylovulum sp.]|nr:DUF1415 domain-containing protein [Methylovulum sp.]